MGGHKTMACLSGEGHGKKKPKQEETNSKCQQCGFDPTTPDLDNVHSEGAFSEMDFLTEEAYFEKLNYINLQCIARFG